MKYFNVLAIFLVMISHPNLGISQGGSTAINETNRMHIMSFNKYLPNASVDAGYYSIKKNKQAVCVRMADERNRNEQHYMIENCFDAKEVVHLSKHSLSITRQSGLLKLNNSNSDFGTFTFTKDADFLNFLTDSGIEINNDLYYFKLFLGDINKAYISAIIRLGFDPTITELGRLVWHDTSIEYIQKLNLMFSDFNLNDISMLSAHEITIAYIEELRAIGIEKMSSHSIKKAKQINLTVKTIQKEKKKGNEFKDLDKYIRTCEKHK